jgi:hypothetical protein
VHRPGGRRVDEAEVGVVADCDGALGRQCISAGGGP